MASSAQMNPLVTRCRVCWGEVTPETGVMMAVGGRRLPWFIVHRERCQQIVQRGARQGAEMLIRAGVKTLRNHHPKVFSVLELTYQAMRAQARAKREREVSR